MQLLEESPDITQRELASRLGISLGSINYCLRALIEKGLVKVKNFSKSKNKFGYIYLLTPDGIAQKARGTQRFLDRKMREYEALRSELDALQRLVESR